MPPAGRKKIVNPLRLRFAIAALALSLWLPACGGGVGGTGGAPGTPSSGSTLRISVTDAPFPSSFVDSASVVIREVRVRDKDVDGWQTVFTGSATIDLVPLTGGVEALLVETAIGPGTYDEVRLIVEAGEVVLNDQAAVDGTDHTFSTANGNLNFPSGAQTGIKVKIDNDIVVTSSLSGDLVLDFDLSRSFVFNGPMTHAPGVKRVLFTPVVRATNASTTGTLTLDAASDNATPDDTADDFPLDGATVRVFDSADVEVAMGLTDATGHFASSIGPAIYRVTVEATSHDTGEVTGVEVFLANVTDAGLVTLVASETEITGFVLSDGATTADTNDDTNVEGALVEARVANDSVLVASDMTDLNGAFALTMLAAGDYDLTITKTGWTDGAVTFASVLAGGAGTTVLLKALITDITGTVTDNAAVAVANASVTVKNANDQTIAGPVTTDTNGVYNISAIPSGAQTLVVDNGGVVTSFPIGVVGTDPAGTSPASTTQTFDVVLP